MLRLAVESYAGDARVGVIASGGLSHFLDNEDFDRQILKALSDKDARSLQRIPRTFVRISKSA